MNTITATVWIIALFLPNGGQVQMPEQYTTYEQCLAQLERLGQANARCIAQGNITVPLPPEITEKLKAAEKAEAAKKK